MHSSLVIQPFRANKKYLMPGRSVEFMPISKTSYSCHQFLQYFILYQLWIVDLKHVFWTILSVIKCICWTYDTISVQNKKAKLFWGCIICVVYFDRLMHACACVRMVENDQKYPTLFEFWNSTLFVFDYDFFSTLRTHTVIFSST